MKKKIIILAIVLLLFVGAFWAKRYYNDRYVAAADYYTQIPEDEINVDSWLVDADGVRQVKGKAYELIGYDEQGLSRRVTFQKLGCAEDYYVPGSYIKVSVSKMLTLGVEAVDEADVPQGARDKIRLRGTRVD